MSLSSLRAAFSPRLADSSFPVFFFLRTGRMLALLFARSFTKYAILGDDIVIADQLVTVQYPKLIEQLGLSISLNKTLLSESGTYEFAKPFILRSREKDKNSP
ncbi:hypothetical protein ES288_D01G152500v1 [Gossypium darwinii]|uniref:Uncharacterized protein n=1 Tax=Gossypium darwinii TaxID=34276 RepID=A0A5D2DQ25_GOSDA|nr:hypothetical protein ES288_D01G152500v1 [Gossypium darwinii]